jgi:glycosyltransferase involved in cell wall biosynthesis
MRFLLDGRPLQGPSAVRGIGTYAAQLLAEYVAMGAGYDVTLLLAEGQPVPRQVGTLDIAVAPVRIPVIHPTLQPIFDPLFVARAIRRLRPALYHGIELAQPLTGDAAVVISVHDLIPFVFPKDYRWVRRARLPALRLLRRADRVLVPSRATQRDLVRIAGVDPKRIEMTPYAVAAEFHPAPAAVVSSTRARLGVEHPYLLAVGTFDPRKRIGLLAGVAARIRAAHPVDLVIAGDQGGFAGAVSRALDDAGVQRQTHLLGHVSHDDLIALYSGAECLVFTSAYEGFGLPPLEAMACGAPVALFDNSSLPEVAGPAALMVEDGDDDAMANAVTRLLGDPADRERRGRMGREWAARFTWRETAAATLAAYEHALQAKRSRLV